MIRASLKEHSFPARAAILAALVLLGTSMCFSLPLGAECHEKPFGQGGDAQTQRAWAHDSIGANTPSEIWYLAEGSTAGGFETWILVQNPQPTTARVEITYMTRYGRVNGPLALIPPYTRESFDVANIVPGVTDVSAMVESDLPVVVERSVYGDDRSWGHCSIGVTEPSDKWYLAEGSTAAGLETWILVQNPSDTWAEVKLQYMTALGETAGPSEFLPPFSRRTFDVADTLEGQCEISTLVSSDAPVVVERAMYGPDRAWGHDSIGASKPGLTWFLAEGCTAQNLETWILIQNPNNTGAEVNLTYMTPWGYVPGPFIQMPAMSRTTFDVSETLPDTWEVSTRVDANRPVVAERAMYGQGRVWGHDSIGAPVPDEEWYLAEGSTGSGFETWILVQNPNKKAARVQLVFMTGAGFTPGPNVSLPPDSRVTFNARDTVGSSQEVSTMVRSDLPVIAERAMYGEKAPVPAAETPVR